ncbi:MAG TPA: Mth938-like domain-containing protein [Stellaceae bacterium]|nr:Mth938-like domain-containing protein [Stellaceae bacterium]
MTKAGLDLTAVAASGRQVIERYAASGFRVSGVIYRGPVLVFPDEAQAWSVVGGEPLTFASLAAVVAHGDVELLLLGLGRRFAPLAPRLRAELRAAGIAVEAMDTGAACRTYNVLVVEDRRVAAALLPPV